MGFHDFSRAVTHQYTSIYIYISSGLYLGSLWKKSLVKLPSRPTHGTFSLPISLHRSRCTFFIIYRKKESTETKKRNTRAFLFVLPWIPCVRCLLASTSYRRRALAHSHEKETENAMWWLGAVESLYHGHDWHLPFSRRLWRNFTRKSSTPVTHAVETSERTH
jgi:hypothetical protein